MKRSKISSNIALFILILFGIVATCKGQKITVSPASVFLWGQTTGYSHVGFEYQNVGVHYFHSEGIEFKIPEKYKRNPDPNVGVSFIPIRAEMLSLGVIAFPKQFPEIGGTRLNLWLELSIPIRNFSFRYIHISNAYQGDVNPGVDLFSLSYSF